jgi:hypothetical protein
MRSDKHPKGDIAKNQPVRTSQRAAPCCFCPGWRFNRADHCSVHADFPLEDESSAAMATIRFATTTGVAPIVAP